MKKLNKIYLAVPYSKMDNELSFEIANRTMVRFLNLRNNVFSPITHTHPIVEMGLTKGTWDYWAEYDCQFIDWADEIIVIIPPTDNGWELVFTSIGVQAEIKYGEKHGKRVRYFDYATQKFVKVPELIEEE